MRLLPLSTFTLSAFALATASLAADPKPRDGWVIHDTDKPYDTLIQDVRSAVTANGMGIVTQAGPTGAAAKRGITIPGNRVIGVFNNDYAVKILGLSTGAMIEAPIRFYVTEDNDGSATLSYKTPSHVFAPYLDEGGATLQALAAELDTRFAVIAEQAVK
ncbi:DUF302 domain-containing protein [Aliisedimentitalea scapharcae]|uniref:DUF302 domain-containing protein n=1 Tax=Aliisedimentitalea scapharcae TaxID=1524259 RepID=A0ABZ2XPD5_9RHOB